MNTCDSSINTPFHNHSSALQQQIIATEQNPVQVQSRRLSIPQQDMAYRECPLERYYLSVFFQVTRQSI